jgi:hypothetical protein
VRHSKFPFCSVYSVCTSHKCSVGNRRSGVCCGEVNGGVFGMESVVLSSLGYPKSALIAVMGYECCVLADFIVHYFRLCADTHFWCYRACCLSFRVTLFLIRHD